MYVLDTCTISDFIKHIDASLNQKILSIPPRHFFVSALTVDEIEYGLSRKPEQAKKFRSLIRQFYEEITPAHILPFDAKVAETAGKMRAVLNNKGISLHQYDLHIGVTALVYGMALVTSNVRHFKMIPNLVVENWRETS